jgi:L-ascorbate metabolism protein UlaG (beta-lactamase superfamily)
MRGGPFVDVAAERVEEVRQFHGRTRHRCRPQVEFSTALETLDELLHSQGHGYSLHPLYPQVPDALRGYVELVYDLRHHASFRLIEALLYDSPYHDASAQSIALSMPSGVDRPFGLTTPRLDSPDVVLLEWTLDDDRLDWLFALKRVPQRWPAIRDRLGLPDDAATVFRSCLTADAPLPYRENGGPGVRWRHFGGACLLLETNTLTILVDPALGQRSEGTTPRYTYADLPPVIDYVLITSNQHDDTMLETLLQIRHKTAHVVVPRSDAGSLHDPSLKLALTHAGFSNVIEIGELETLTFDGGDITGIPFLGAHGDLSVRSKLAYVLRLGNERLMVAAQLSAFEPNVYDHVRSAIGDVGTLFLGMGGVGRPLSRAYGSLLLRPIDRDSDQSRSLKGPSLQHALALVERLRVRELFIYSAADEPRSLEADELVQACLARGIGAGRLHGEREILTSRV